MEIARHTLEAPRERILRGADGWWFLGPGGRARLSARHLTTDTRLRPEAERYLRERGLFAPAPYRTYALTVLTSTDCNLGCGYCFQNTGVDEDKGLRPPRIAHARLTSPTITRILEFTKQRMAAAGFDQLRLMLFGGEPLLNPRGCAELLRRAAGFGLVEATMTSNGVLLTPALAQELHALGLKTVQVTFDGDRAQHDRIRVARTGGGTFDVILDNMALVGRVAPIRWLLRINVSHRNVAGMGPLIDRLAKRLDPSTCRLAFARINDAGFGYHNDLSHDEELATAFTTWQRQAVDLGFDVPVPQADTPCQACSFKNGRYGAVISADGTMSSCWETAGRPEWVVGTVERGYLPDEQVHARWTSCEAASNVDAEAITRFQDRIDAELLDYLQATGRLAHRVAR